MLFVVLFQQNYHGVKKNTDKFSVNMWPNLSFYKQELRITIGGYGK